MKGQGLTERHALRVVGMSASSLRYQPAPVLSGFSIITISERMLDNR